jgi:hypothetical protein
MGQIYDLTHEENMSGHKGLATNRSKAKSSRRGTNVEKSIQSLLKGHEPQYTKPTNKSQKGKVSIIT